MEEHFEQEHAKLEKEFAAACEQLKKRFRKSGNEGNEGKHEKEIKLHKFKLKTICFLREKGW